MGEVGLMPYDMPLNASDSEDGIEEVQIESSSKPGEFYTVEISAEYESCTCVGFHYRRRCRHIREARTRIEVDADSPL
jgi:hypothetical protein